MPDLLLKRKNAMKNAWAYGSQGYDNKFRVLYNPIALLSSVI